MKRKDTYKKLKGTIQADAVIERIREMQNSIRSVMDINIHDSDAVAEVRGRQIAIKYLEHIARELQKEEDKKIKNEYA